MRAHPSERFAPSVAWEAARGFLLLHAGPTDGGRLSPEAIELVMLGVWVGCRLALLERELAFGIAASGNEHDGAMYGRLRRGFAIEFDGSVEELVRDLLFEHGFMGAPAESCATPAAPDLGSTTATIAAAQGSLRNLGGLGFGGAR